MRAGAVQLLLLLTLSAAEALIESVGAFTTSGGPYAGQMLLATHDGTGQVMSCAYEYAEDISANTSARCWSIDVQNDGFIVSAPLELASVGQLTALHYNPGSVLSCFNADGDSSVCAVITGSQVSNTVTLPHTPRTAAVDGKVVGTTRTDAVVGCYYVFSSIGIGECVSLIYECTDNPATCELRLAGSPQQFDSDPITLVGVLGGPMVCRFQDNVMSCSTLSLSAAFELQPVPDADIIVFEANDPNDRNRFRQVLSTSYAMPAYDKEVRSQQWSVICVQLGLTFDDSSTTCYPMYATDDGTVHSGDATPIDDAIGRITVTFVQSDLVMLCYQTQAEGTAACTDATLTFFENTPALRLSTSKTELATGGIAVSGTAVLQFTPTGVDAIACYLAPSGEAADGEIECQSLSVTRDSQPSNPPGVSAPPRPPSPPPVEVNCDRNALSSYSGGEVAGVLLACVIGGMLLGCCCGAVGGRRAQGERQAANSK